MAGKIKVSQGLGLVPIYVEVEKIKQVTPSTPRGSIIVFVDGSTMAVNEPPHLIKTATS